MLFLWLPMLMAFAIALAYFALLCLGEVIAWLRDRRDDVPARPVLESPMAQVKRLTSEMRFMTREMSPLFGFGDD